jgi:hypothetical protein
MKACLEIRAELQRLEVQVPDFDNESGVLGFAVLN